jgi:hypothetical protein
MRDRWLIVSHERSGTEWLIASIVKNIFPTLWQKNTDRQVCWDLDGDRFYDPEVMERVLYEDIKTRVKPLFHCDGKTMVRGDDPHVPVKSHHAFDFFEPIWDQIIEAFNVVYIMRDGRDVMTSMWNHGWDHDGFMPKAFNPERFSALKPTEEMGRYHGDYHVENMAQRWSRHLESWWDREGVYYVTYEQMTLRYNQTIRAIAAYAGLKIPVEIETPGLTGIRPWRGKVGNWRQFGDFGYFWCDAKPGMRILRAHNDPLLDDWEV